MELTGRLTDGAKVNRLTDGRDVVNFCIAINERYKSKAGELKRVTAFINCSYWISTKVAQYLNKGAIVSLFGSISSKVYIDSNGEPQSVLNCHVNNIRFVAKAPKQEAKPAAVTATSSTTSEVAPTPATKDDLPF